MKNTLTILLIIASVIFTLTGCIKQETTYKINPDGSGIIEETISIKKEMIEMLRAMPLPPGDDDMEEPPEKDPAKMMESMAKNKVKYFGTGVEFKEIKKTEKGKIIVYTTTYSVKDISKINVDVLSMGPIDTTISMPGMIMKPGESPETGGKDKNVPKMPETTLFSFEFKQQDDGSAQLTIKNHLEKTIKEMNSPKKDKKEAPEEKPIDEEEEEEEGEGCEGGEIGPPPMPPFPPDAGNDEMNKMMIEMTKQMLKDASFNITLVCGKAVSQTNATYVKDNKITLVDVDFNQIIKNKDKLKEFMKVMETPPENPIKALEALKEFGIKIELKETVTVEFK